MRSISIAAADPQSDCFAGPCRNHFSVGGIAVEVLAEDARCTELGPQLLPFARGMDGTVIDASDIQVRIAWSSRIDPSQGKELFHSGSLWTAHELKGKFLFDFTTERLGSRPYKRLVTDEDFQRADVFLNRECFPSQDASALEYPLDELLITHHLSLGRGVELHACGLVHVNGESFLFAGHSGAGKSTTARLWTRHLRVGVLSDDRIIVRKHGNRFLMYGTPWHGEAAFASPTQAPVRRIFFLDHGTENRIERVSRSAAVGELLARSFTPFYQPRFVNPVLALLEEFVDAVPCYRFQFVPNCTAVERILEFRD